MIKQIPNILTSLNLLCGCVAVLFVVSGDLIVVAFFVVIGIIFDFLDGFAARLLKTQSKTGLQFDSLADMVTSGLVPGLVMLQLLNVSIFGNTMTISETLSPSSLNNEFSNYLPFVGLLVTVASGYRLAKFNVDIRQTDSFIGLPTPANTLLILSLPLILEFQNSHLIESVILNKWFLLGVILVSCILLNSKIHLFALKFKTWDFKNNAIRYVFLLLSLIALILMKFIAIPIIITLYVIISVFQKIR
ncbi:MAG: CDP-alcohol phosphatidyltransferase family protein [Bacteroidetes bacterium]|nr:CDP-alcohol phosphatidyltransferase family protein [Bacteroidota bacterium]